MGLVQLEIRRYCECHGRCSRVSGSRLAVVIDSRMLIWLTCCAWSASNLESSIFSDILSKLESSIEEVGRVLSARAVRGCRSRSSGGCERQKNAQAGVVVSTVLGLRNVAAEWHCDRETKHERQLTAPDLRLDADLTHQ